MLNLLSPLLIDLGIVALALTGVTMLVLTFLNHLWHTGRETIFTPLALIFSSGAAAAFRQKSHAWQQAYRSREDRKILLTAVIIVMVSSAATALVTIGVMADKQQRHIEQMMHGRRAALVSGLDEVIGEKSQAMDKIAHAQDAMAQVVARLELLRPIGLRIVAASGKVLAHEGDSNLEAWPGLSFTPHEGQTVVLQRDPHTLKFRLRVQEQIARQGKTLGSADAVFALKTANIFSQHAGQISAHSYIDICHLHAGKSICLPRTRNDPVSTQEFPLQTSAIHPGISAAMGQSGTRFLNHALVSEFASYGPISQTGLGLALVAPGSDLYAPVIQAAETGLLILPGLILLGIALLAWRLRPLVRQLHRDKAQMETIFEYSGVGILLTNGEGAILDCNPAFAALLGYSRNELRQMQSVRSLIHPDEMEQVAAQLGDMEDRIVNAYCSQRRYLHRNGTYRLLRWHVSPVVDESGQVALIAGYCIDVTEELQRKEALTRQSVFLSATLDSLQDMVISCNEHGLLTYANRAAAKIGVPTQSSLSLDQLAMITPVYSPDHQLLPLNQLPLETALRGETLVDEEFAMQSASGQWRQFQMSGYPLRDPAGRLIGAAEIARDVTDIRAAETHLHWLLTHDDLTRLPNRRSALAQINSLIQSIGSDLKVSCGVMLIDIDRFKHINDRYGHVFGDQLLIAVSQRLVARLGADATLFRLGSDEFALMTKLPRDEGRFAELENQVISAFDETFQIMGRILFISATGGLACSPQDGTSADELLRNADITLYRAKQHAPGRIIRHDPAMRSGPVDLVEMESDLRQAFEAHAFTVHYQPKAHLGTNILVGAEALIRWEHPTRGFIAPDVFIPKLEEMGLIVSVGHWVLQTVCQQIRDWQAAGLAAVPVAVNCSVRQLQGDLIIRQVTEALDRSGIDPRLLELEITESMMLQDPSHVTELLTHLSELGIDTAIDDFGTGYSSLASLKRLPVKTIKLDRAFIRDLPHNADDEAITRAVMSMAKALHLQVVAEGVETLEQASFLQSLGCESYQGWLFSRAVPAEQFAQFLR